MSSQGPWLRISSALYKEFRASARAKPKGVALRPHRGDRLALGQGLPVANGPVLHPTVASDALDPEISSLVFSLPNGHLKGSRTKSVHTGRQVVCEPTIRRKTSVTKATYTHLREGTPIGGVPPACGGMSATHSPLEANASKWRLTRLAGHLVLERPNGWCVATWRA